ncbi:hypothetical protein BpHYR1_006362 [Brachionus plicatilis]|uniref:Uncharacterized protein n=1 Tax=Brachionus plicatilis TaxID=10195 RepID=A0A3M7S9Y1_BRAPC|nr:hypothetical protein BpHYR1_006362 [Brachionus plicatilis]
MNLMRKICSLIDYGKKASLWRLIVRFIFVYYPSNLKYLRDLHLSLSLSMRFKFRILRLGRDGRDDVCCMHQNFVSIYEGAILNKGI